MNAPITPKSSRDTALLLLPQPLPQLATVLVHAQRGVEHRAASLHVDERLGQAWIEDHLAQHVAAEEERLARGGARIVLDRREPAIDALRRLLVRCRELLGIPQRAGAR